jgi:hypothetical protein
VFVNANLQIIFRTKCVGMSVIYLRTKVNTPISDVALFMCITPGSHVVILHSTERAKQMIHVFLKIYYHTYIQGPKLCGAWVSLVSQVRAFAILMLHTGGNLKKKHDVGVASMSFSYQVS